VTKAYTAANAHALGTNTGIFVTAALAFAVGFLVGEGLTSRLRRKPLPPPPELDEVQWERLQNHVKIWLRTRLPIDANLRQQLESARTMSHGRVQVTQQELAPFEEQQTAHIQQQAAQQAIDQQTAQHEEQWVDAIEIELAKFTRDLKRRKEQLAPLQQENVGLHDQLQNSEEKAMKLNEDVDKAQEKITTTNAENADLCERLQRLEKDVERLNSNLKEATTTAEKATEKLESLEKELLQSEDDARTLRLNLDTARDEVAEEKKNTSEALKIIDGYEIELAETQKELQKEKADRKKAEEELKTEKTRREKAEERSQNRDRPRRAGGTGS
jgi:chromosome segregation ATPase